MDIAAARTQRQLAAPAVGGRSADSDCYSWDFSMLLAPVLEREEYVEQAYFFRVFRERLRENLAAQDILSQIHEEVLSTTRLPYAIQFLATELKHGGLLAPAMQRLGHYFTAFQAFVMSRAEAEGLRFSMDTALMVLEGEARYRSKAASPPGLFVYQFEALSRNRLGYDEGLTAMAADSYYDNDWRQFIEIIRRNIGEVEFADLVYLRSELYVQDQARRGSDEAIPRPLFGEKEGKIAKASRGRDPLFMFAALQRQLGYPEVPRPRPRDDPAARIDALQARLREFDMRLKILESEARGRADVIQTLGKPEIFKKEDDYD